MIVRACVSRTLAAPTPALSDLHAAREAEVKAALALQDARDEAGFGAYDQQKRVQDAARGE